MTINYNTETQSRKLKTKALTLMLIKLIIIIKVFQNLYDIGVKRAKVFQFLRSLFRSLINPSFHYMLKKTIFHHLAGLFHDALNNEIRSEMAFLKASQLNLAKFMIKETTETDTAAPLTSPQQTVVSQVSVLKRNDTSQAEMSPKQDISGLDVSETGIIKQEISEMHSDNVQEESSK